MAPYHSKMTEPVGKAVKCITVLAAEATGYASSSVDTATSAADGASAAAAPRAACRGKAAAQTWALATTSPRRSGDSTLPRSTAVGDAWNVQTYLNIFVTTSFKV